jgi:hypothetical protein
MSANVTLGQILDLVGKLDDTPGNETARERLRNFLRESVTEAGQPRDYVEEALRTPGHQYNRSSQDVVNHTGRFLCFDGILLQRARPPPGGQGTVGRPQVEKGGGSLTRTTSKSLLLSPAESRKPELSR